MTKEQEIVIQIIREKRKIVESLDEEVRKGRDLVERFPKDLTAIQGAAKRQAKRKLSELRHKRNHERGKLDMAREISLKLKNLHE